MGHECGLPDFYEDNDRPAGGFPTPTIMWTGNSMTITNWDIFNKQYYNYKKNGYAIIVLCL
ncbi:hypothetical protein KPL47_10860 [Clostridium estertheticum]|uniref:hypothetical protein n=1 Tax=Clostridium estertheticum TaxID=238834 RepID=UPI001C0D1CA6|nr:hypothetical protein [Clostridium estertheticum]MBU3176871.1 hypothetical protein [Clostridium estertheticum]